MNRTIRIESPGCDNEYGFCPYLDTETAECWGVDDQDTLAKAQRLEAECKARANEARRTNGKKRSLEFVAANPGYVSRRDRTPKPATPKPAPAKRTKKPAGWHKTMTHLLTPRQPEPEGPRLPPCDPTVAGVIARYHVSKQVVRGWILDGLMRVDADGTVDAESMARVARCYQPRRASRWMERTLAEYGEV